MKKKDTVSLDKSSDFESFLGELSAELVNIPLESIDSAIESSMKRLVEFFDANRCHIVELSNDPDHRKYSS